MKVSEIITRVRNIAGDVAVLQFTDPMLIDWINDGIRECAVNNNLLQKRATSNTIVGDSTYDLPLDILKLHSVTLDGQKLRIVTLQEFEALHDTDEVSSGLPSTCYVWAGIINLYPTPDRVGSFVVSYTYDPAVILTDGTYDNESPVLPVGYHARLVDYCLAQVAQQDGDSNLYQLKMNEFTTGVQNLKDMPEWENDLYPSMSVSLRDRGDDYSW